MDYTIVFIVYGRKSQKISRYNFIPKKFNKVLFLTCSNRYKNILKTQSPKSTILAEVMLKKLDNVTIINVPDLVIHPCEGNVSREDGNKCGIKQALLKDKEKNPSGYHRCWASLHNPDDELWKISKELFNRIKRVKLLTDEALQSSRFINIRCDPSPQLYQK